MFASVILSVFLGASAVFGSPFNTTRRTCGTFMSDADILASEKFFQRNKATFASALPATLKVHFHVISKDTTLSGGNVPNSQIQDQMTVLNKAFANSNTGLSFSLAGITRTINADWFNNVAPGNSQQTAMKTLLRVGGAADLNVYTVGFTSSGLLAYTTFPSSYASNPIDDGIVILYSTLPGGTTPPYNLGINLVHEVGHWLGLFHTFTGGCSGFGDFVADTPPEAQPSIGCPEGRDTCAGGGVDPIHNYMDFSDDFCLNQFTPGQATRIEQQLAMYRGV